MPKDKAKEMHGAAAMLMRLTREGYRLTGQRRAVMEEVMSRRAPFTSGELLEAMLQASPGIGRATVFRTLDLLARLDVVQRIYADADGEPCHMYMACDGSHHHHLICRHCGIVVDFREEATLNKLINDVEDSTEFEVEGHRLELVGLCPKCQRAGVL